MLGYGLGSRVGFWGWMQTAEIGVYVMFYP
jgi:hypothetical protein